MKTQSPVFPLLILLISSSLISTFATSAPASADPKTTPQRLGGGGARVGGYKPISDIKDPHVQEVGKFAVTEYNKQAKTNLRFDRVIKGQSQVVSGINYRLVIAANKGGAIKNYIGEVYEKPWEGYMNLTSFRAGAV